MPNDIGVLKDLPAELAYLVAPAMKYGVHQFDDDIDRFLKTAAEEEMSELARVAEKVRLNDHFDKVNDWLDRHEIDEHAEASYLYFLFGVMDAADLEFD